MLLDFEEQMQEEHAVRQILSEDSGETLRRRRDILLHRLRQGVSKTLMKNPMNTTSTLLLTLTMKKSKTNLPLQWLKLKAQMYFLARNVAKYVNQKAV